ncbi:MAG: hypothetical protein ACP5UH_01240 [Candidatus Micrarchaeia archaeon]
MTIIFGIYVGDGDGKASGIAIGADEMKHKNKKNVYNVGNNTLFGYASSNYKLPGIMAILERYSAELDSDLESGLRKARAELLEIADGEDTLLFAGLTDSREPIMAKVVLNGARKSGRKSLSMRFIDEKAVAGGAEPFGIMKINTLLNEYSKRNSRIGMDETKKLIFIMIKDITSAGIFDTGDNVDIGVLKKSANGAYTTRIETPDFEEAYKAFRRERLGALDKALRQERGNADIASILRTDIKSTDQGREKAKR